MKLATLSGLALFLVPTLTLAADVEPTAARVAAVLRSASVFVAGNPSIALTPGTDIKEGAVITTGPRSAVDLFLGNEAGTIRLTENATLAITKFKVGAEQKVEEIQLHLSAGSLLGLGNKLPQEKLYQIKITSGVIDVQARQFRIGSDGLVVAVDGKLLFAHIAAEGTKPVLHELKAPPPVYFWPTLGIRPAPQALISEIAGQAKIQLPVK